MQCNQHLLTSVATPAPRLGKTQKWALVLGPFIADQKKMVVNKLTK